MATKPHKPDQPILAAHGAHMSGIISQIGQGEWRAAGNVQVHQPDSVLEQKIGPSVFGSEKRAREWLRTEGRQRGFESFDIAVKPLEDGNA